MLNNLFYLLAVRYECLKMICFKSNSRYVRYCMKFVEMLLTFRVKPILVFDGRYLPSKQEVEKARRE